MHVLVAENYPNTTLGLIGEALAEAGARCDIRRLHMGAGLPADPTGYDAFIMLGGAQNALDDANHPYLSGEAGLARAFGDADRPVLGICLGAQLLARAHGATNVLGRPLEFGWHPVATTEAGQGDPVFRALGAGAPVFHWHFDTFTLPPGAAHLATSGQTAMQAFRVGRASYGVQFHFEAGTALVADWTRDFAGEIEEIAPDWFTRYHAEAARNGAAADAAGLALARAWIALAAPSSRSPATGGRITEAALVAP